MRNEKTRCSHKGTKTLIVTSALLIISGLTGCGKIETDTGQHPISKEVTLCTTSTTPTTSALKTTISTNMTITTETTATKANYRTKSKTTTSTATNTIIYNTVQFESVNNNNAKIIHTEPLEIICTATVSLEEYVVYKPSTYYIHRNTCRWNCGDAYKISDTNGIEARKCSECNPNIEIVNEYVQPTVSDSLPITEEERILLCNLVGREYGSDWVPVSEKAKVVAVVMNRVNDSRFPDTIYDVLTQPYQFSGYIPNYSYTSQVTDSVIEAVNYYFAHPDEFGNWLFFEGDGTWNYFS